MERSVEIEQYEERREIEYHSVYRGEGENNL
jgi:hypothetical protein